MSQAPKRTNKLFEFFQLLFGHPMGLAGLVIITMFVAMATVCTVLRHGGPCRIRRGRKSAHAAFFPVLVRDR